MSYVLIIHVSFIPLVSRRSLTLLVYIMNIYATKLSIIFSNYELYNLRENM